MQVRWTSLLPYRVYNGRNLKFGTRARNHTHVHWWNTHPHPLYLRSNFCCLEFQLCPPSPGALQSQTSRQADWEKLWLRFQHSECLLIRRKLVVEAVSLCTFPNGDHSFHLCITLWLWEIAKPKSPHSSVPFSMWSTDSCSAPGVSTVNSSSSVTSGGCFIHLTFWMKGAALHIPEWEPRPSGSTLQILFACVDP